MAQLFSQRTLTIGGMEPCAVGLQFHKTGFDQKENVVLFVCCEVVESKLVKLETICTVIFPQWRVLSDLANPKVASESTTP